MTFDWIDGKTLPESNQLVWAEVKDITDQQHYYTTCYYTNTWCSNSRRALHDGDTVIRYFILPVEQKIKNCSHCGGVAVLLTEVCPITNIIACKKCGLRTAKYKTEIEALEAWNRRV